ncbi:hypothetical protein HG535_0A02470 [Zygotorulaspora mrakii]|uniref:Transcriptional regulatory protein RXT2 N-terminal domain-containing protein n=1 Tax=Zygotorulaspora mrakii TaxID=42260 RepID=A0A7H9AX00_ZYGMR|nr:uncharacterized protein HG535_0A02470 [Zygotorulaspora mrakii]QLG70309.1 hypothetical protein HG535_0A02470 [Zygotorulaspora mrakii]
MTSDDVLSVSDEHKYISTFCRHVIKEKSGNYPVLKRSLDGTIVYQDAAGVTSNRGNKLLQKSELVSREVINSSKPINEDFVYYNGSEHKLLQRKRIRFTPPETEWEMADETGYDAENVDNNEEELSRLVDVKKVLLPISSLADVSKRSPIARVFENNVLRNLALQSILMIEKEQYSVIKYSKFLEVFLGDNPKPLYEPDLHLPAYDHNLTLPDEEDTNDAEEKEKETAKDQPDLQNEDPFFALPKISASDTMLQLLPEMDSVQVSEEAETARQLAQIALQRNQEYIRNLRKIRNVLVKANRMKERIQAWSREYVGMQEDDVIVPNALRVVKRGLISATTNRSMSGRKVDAGEELNEENEIDDVNEANE